MKTIFTSILVIFMLSFSFAEIADTTDLQASANIINESAQGAYDGSIDLTISGGTSPYNVSWSNDADTEDINGLTEGIYDVTIYDADSLSVTYSYEIRVEGSAGDSTSNACDNFYGNSFVTNTSQANNDGAIDLTVYGGTMPYTYNWSTGASTEDIEGLAPGHYTVEVLDDNGCDFILSAYVYESEIDSSETNDPIDTLTTDEPIDTCFNNSVDHVVINSYVIGEDYIETSWMIFDTDNNLMGTFTAVYYMTNDSAGIYEFVVTFECNNNRAVSSSYSYPLYINRAVAAGIQTIYDESSIVNIYPNPVNNIAFVNIDANQSSEAQITIVSITGQLISTQQVSLNTGKNVVNINTSSLEKGMNILKLTQNKQTIVQRFIK